jgi:hypothetical protein
MRNVWLLVLVLAACGGGKKDKFDAAVAEMDAIATKMCACKDADCTSKVQAELLELRKTFKDRFGKDKPSADQDKQGRAAEERLRTCRTKASGEAQSFEDVLAKLATYRTEMCACADKACSDKVLDGWKAYRATMKDQLGKAATPSDEQDARGKVLDTEMKACRGKFEPAEASPKP